MLVITKYLLSRNYYQLFNFFYPFFTIFVFIYFDFLYIFITFMYVSQKVQRFTHRNLYWTDLNYELSLFSHVRLSIVDKLVPYFLRYNHIDALVNDHLSGSENRTTIVQYIYGRCFRFQILGHKFFKELSKSVKFNFSTHMMSSTLVLKIIVIRL